MQKHTPPIRSLLSAGALLCAASVSQAQVSYTGGTYSQNFDSLSSTATAAAPAAFTDNATLLGWYAQAIDTLYTGSGLFTFTMTGALNAQADDYQANNGSGTSGDLYSYGSTSSADRALGTLGSGTPDDFFVGLRVQNDTGLPITRFTLTYDGEQWRRGANNPQRPEGLLVYYRIGGADFIGSTGWTEVPELAFTSPNAASADITALALDGNAVGNKVVGITKEVILSAPLAPGESIWITWVDVDNGGTDHGLAIDNVNFSAVTSSGSDISRGSGAIFTPTSFGGNAFASIDTAVFDGSATTVSLSGNVVAAGLRFSTDGYTVAGTASDSLSVSGTINVFAGVGATISGVLAGGNGLTKIGDGTLTLAAANTFTGPVSINAGTVVIGSEASFGDAANDVALTGTLVTASSTLSLGSGRSFSGSGTIQTGASGTLSFAGPVAAGALNLVGPTTLNFGGATNSVASLNLPSPSTINVTGGALQFTSGLVLGQTDGATAINGPVTFASGDKTFPVTAGNLSFNGTLTYGGGRLVKTGAGVLDLTSAAASGTGGIRIGVVGASPASAGEGGRVIVDGAGDIGTVQMHFNSGTLQATAPIVSTAGVSFGGRAATDRSSVLSIPTFTGSDMTFTGATGFFYSNFAPATDTDLAIVVNNVTRLNGTFTKTGTAQQWIVPGGSGTLVIGGDARALIDDILVIDTLTLAVDGQLGGRKLIIDDAATLAGSGTFTGWVTTTTTTSTDTPPVVTTTTTYSADSLATIEGTLSPTGLLTFNSGLQLVGSTVLDIAGTTRGGGYDSVAVINPDTTGISYTLTYGGTLNLRFTGAAINGSYTLFETGANVSRAGAFASVSLSGNYSGSLGASGSVWSGVVGGVTFSFDESTGVLTVTGGVSPTTPLQDWRQANFGTTANSGNAADSSDYDNDGIPNLLEYATGTNPTAANVGVVTLAKSGDFLTLSFPVISDASLTYSVQASNDLASFATATGTVSTTGGVRTYTDNVSLATPGVRRFLRLQVGYGQ